jgi:hypothetical protein
MLEYIIPIWNIAWLYGIFYGDLVILGSFGIFSPVLVYCEKINLATLERTRDLLVFLSFNFHHSPADAQRYMETNTIYLKR